MQETDLHWLAGLCEGEACFRVDRGRRRQDGKIKCAAGFAMNSTDRDVLERAGALIGSRVTGPYKSPYSDYARKPYFTITASGERARSLLDQLRPLMGERRTQKIDEILAVHGQLVD